VPDAIELIVLRVREQTLNQALQLLRWQCRDPHEPRVQTLQLQLRERIEIHTRSGVGRAHRLPPAQQDFGVASRVNGPLTQTTLDLRVARRLTTTHGCAGAEATTRLCELRLGVPVADEFAEASRRATAGNPFFLEALLREVDEQEYPTNTLGAARVERVGPAAVAQAGLLRLSGAPAAGRDPTDRIHRPAWRTAVALRKREAILHERDRRGHG
jgi:hypothetical protein